jgi:hypothetical protein
MSGVSAPAILTRRRRACPADGEEAVAPGLCGALKFPVEGEIIRGNDLLEAAHKRASKD